MISDHDDDDDHVDDDHDHDDHNGDDDDIDDDDSDNDDDDDASMRVNISDKWYGEDDMGDNGDDEDEFSDGFLHFFGNLASLQKILWDWLTRSFGLHSNCQVPQ